MNSDDICTSVPEKKEAVNAKTPVVKQLYLLHQI